MSETEFVLTPQERALLEPIIKTLSDRAKTNLSVELLVFKWAALVRRVAGGFDDSIYEYTNDLAIRTLLEHVLEQAPEPIRTKLNRAVNAIDAQFRLTSREVPIPVQRSSPTTTWWFYRVPLKPGDELQADLEAEGIG